MMRSVMMMHECPPLALSVLLLLLLLPNQKRLIFGARQRRSCKTLILERSPICCARHKVRGRRCEAPVAPGPPGLQLERRSKAGLKCFKNGSEFKSLNSKNLKTRPLGREAAFLKQRTGVSDTDQAWKRPFRRPRTLFDKRHSAGRLPSKIHFDSICISLVNHKL